MHTSFSLAHIRHLYVSVQNKKKHQFAQES